jgi:hypothetical protein
VQSTRVHALPFGPMHALCSPLLRELRAVQSTDACAALSTAACAVQSS